MFGLVLDDSKCCRYSLKTLPGHIEDHLCASCSSHCALRVIHHQRADPGFLQSAKMLLWPAALCSSRLPVLTAIEAKSTCTVCPALQRKRSSLADSLACFRQVAGLAHVARVCCVGQPGSSRVAAKLAVGSWHQHQVLYFDCTHITSMLITRQASLTHGQGLGFCGLSALIEDEID